MGKFNFGQTGVSYECDKVDLRVNEGARRCPRCDHFVYFNEEKKAFGKSWHARCFTCCECMKTLSSTNYNEYAGDIMCTTCHRRHSRASITQTTNNTAASTASSSVAAADDNDADQSHSFSQVNSPRRLHAIDRQHADRCPRCGDRVYFAEEILALRRKWHRRCFKCVSCKKTLEPGKCSEHDEQLFCQQCYCKQFGPLAVKTTSSLSPAAATEALLESDSSCRVGNGAVAYLDTFETVTVGHDDEEPLTQPIKGTQEWTESIVYDQSSSDCQQYVLH